MGKLAKYYKSKINVISVHYGNDHVQINIAREAKIHENDIENEIKSQPSNYAFLFMLHKKLLTEFELLKTRRKAEFGRLLAIAKQRKGPSGRPLSDSDAKAWVESHKKYIRITEACIYMKDKADSVLAGVKAFEQKKDLLQTLSSNLRKERD